jgi:heme/copper-type cytochrome/quinol oxidase subunit 3
MLPYPKNGKFLVYKRYSRIEFDHSTIFLIYSAVTVAVAASAANKQAQVVVWYFLLLILILYFFSLKKI